LPGFVQDRGDGFGAEGFCVAGEFCVPEAERFRVRDAAQHAMPKVVVSIDARQVDQRGVLARYQRRNAMKKKVFQPWFPGI